MLVLKLVYENDIEVASDIIRFKNKLEEKKIIIGLIEKTENNSNVLEVITKDDSSKREIETIKKYISNIFYKYIIKKYKKNELFDYITENYFFLRQKEILEIEDIIMKVLLLEQKPTSDIFVFCYRKINNILDNIIECILENDEINISGFLTFRMKEISRDIEKVIDKIIERYIIEKEYEEFIDLLKYFISIQDSKIELVNIYIKPQDIYSIMDKDGNDIFDKLVDELDMAQVDFVEVDVADIIISGLITNAPQKIIIHGRNNCSNLEFLNTIELVFESRVVFCQECDFCNLYKNNLTFNR